MGGDGGGIRLGQVQLLLAGDLALAYRVPSPPARGPCDASVDLHGHVAATEQIAAHRFWLPRHKFWLSRRTPTRWRGPWAQPPSRRYWSGSSRSYAGARRRGRRLPPPSSFTVGLEYTAPSRSRGWSKRRQGPGQSPSPGAKGRPAKSVTGCRLSSTTSRPALTPPPSSAPCGHVAVA
jgi:hypothetical protein